MGFTQPLQVFSAGHLPLQLCHILRPKQRSFATPPQAQAEKRSGACHATRSCAPFPAAAQERAPRGLWRGHPERLPMSELQKASWGWLGEHVHASAPQSPRLQLPRSTTSPSQGVIAAAAAEAAARLSKVVRAAGGAAAARALLLRCARQLWPRARCPGSAQPDGTGQGEAASALAHDSAGRRSLRVQERELGRSRTSRRRSRLSARPLPALRRCRAAE